VLRLKIALRYDGIKNIKRDLLVQNNTYAIKHEPENKTMYVQKLRKTRHLLPALCPKIMELSF